MIALSSASNDGGLNEVNRFASLKSNSSSAENLDDIESDACRSPTGVRQILLYIFSQESNERTRLTDGFALFIKEYIFHPHSSVLNEGLFRNNFELPLVEIRISQCRHRAAVITAPTQPSTFAGIAILPSVCGTIDVYQPLLSTTAAQKYPNYRHLYPPRFNEIAVF